MMTRLIQAVSYFFEGLVESGQIANLPLADSRRIVIYHLSTIDHLAVLLEQIAAAEVAEQVEVASMLSDSEISRASEANKLPDGGWRLLNQAEPSGSGPADLAVMLYSFKAESDTVRQRKLRGAFAAQATRCRIIIHGDGTLWRGDFISRLSRRLLRPVLARIIPWRDRLELAAIDRILAQFESAKMRLDGGGAASGGPVAARNIVLAERPIRVELTPNGTAVKTELLSHDEEDALYEDGYHFRIYLDERPDWAELLRVYQQRRWRNMMKAGVGEIARPDTGPTALDIGCGTGCLAAKLADEGFVTLGVDRSWVAIEQAVRSFPQAQFSRARFEEMQSAEQTFDLITLSHVLEHARDDAGFLLAIAPLMTPDSRLYIEVPLFDRQAIASRPFWHRQRDHYREYSRRGLAEVAAVAGFEVLAHHDSLNDEGAEPYQFLLARRKG